MKILATGDSHLGKGADIGLTPGGRLEEQEQVWRSTLKFARTRRFDAVLHAGDLFDGRRPGPDVMLAAERALVEHRDAGGCNVYVIAGNHDVPSQDGPCGLDVLEQAGLIWLAREPKVWNLGDVDVCALPWTPLSRLVAADEGETPRDQLAALAADLLLRTADDMRDSSRQQILLGHWSVSGTSLPNGLPVDGLGGVVLDMGALQEIGYDALVFGHIHREQQVGSFLYVGSPQPLDFGEAKDPHGCWIVDTSLYGVPQFVKMPSPGFVTYDLTEGEVAAMAAGIMPLLDPALPGYVKVRYTASEEQARRIDLARLRTHAAGGNGSRVFVEATVERVRRQRGVMLDDTGSRIDQLAAYLDATRVNGDVKPAMLAKAEAYL